MKQSKTPTTEGNPLHTQGEWEVKLFDKLVVIVSPECKDGILTVTSGNVKQCKADAELIVKAVNERQALLDSQKELLAELKKMADSAEKNTRNIVAFDGARLLDFSIDRARKIIAKYNNQ